MTKINIEDMDHYEILSVSRDASFEEIEKAYLIGKTAYSKDSFAHYTLIEEDERKKMLDRIESAFVILGDEKNRQAYNENISNKRNRYKEKAQFRHTTKRMIFEDFHTNNNHGTPFFRRLFSSIKKP